MWPCIVTTGELNVNVINIIIIARNIEIYLILSTCYLTISNKTGVYTDMSILFPIISPV